MAFVAVELKFYNLVVQQRVKHLVYRPCYVQLTPFINTTLTIDNATKQTDFHFTFCLVH